MKHLIFLFLILLIFVSCKKEEKVPIAELHADDYKIQWIGVNYDSIEKEEIELLIPKDKSKDTIFNQLLLYRNGVLSKKNSQYYDLEVLKTEQEHTYRAVIKMYSEYSELKTDEFNERTVDIFFSIIIKIV
ncbi:hypothetical protein [Myroides indicus]|uniref:Lipoprotein n=1 Tax=Myroides indicus TaxID=1323422 RepID=A0A4R7ESA6_9FLAO|nr:hypothetical protein [Myroides indicus]TDS51094.1 hypothetical protein C8P70_1439 [Myroides indicus]